MSITGTIVEKLFGAMIEKKVQERLPAAGAGPANLDDGWRRLSGNSNRELPIALWQRQVEIAYWLWKTNPLGNWIIETLAVFAGGKGFTYTADDPEVKQLLDDFWFDPVNRMDLKLENKVRELFLFGVQCWPVFKGENTGKVRLGMVDPAQIAEIYADPQNAEVLIGVKIQALHSAQTRYLRTILTGETETVISEDARILREGWTDGECFLFAINRVSNDPYGSSDLFVIADWLDEYEEFVYNFAGKARQQNAFIWDVEVQGADEAICSKIANDYAKNPDGAVRVHNEKMKWEAKAPNLQALEIKEAASVIRNHILGNKSIPEHWYGGGGNVNRATAGESNEAIMALIDSRQNLVKFIIETIFTYIIRCALDTRYLAVPEDQAFDFAVQKPETSNRDLTKISSAIQSLTAAMVMAQTQGWVTAETAIKLWAFIIALTGFEIDPEEALETDPTEVVYKTKGKNATFAPGRPNAPSARPDAATNP